MSNVIQFPSAKDGLEVLKWKGNSLEELGISDGDLLFYTTEVRQIPFDALCIVEIEAIEERRVKVIESFAKDMVYLTPVSHIYERSIFHISEIKIIGQIIEWF